MPAANDNEPKADLSKVKTICAGIKKLAAESKAEKAGVAAAKVEGKMPCLPEYAKRALAAARIEVANAALQAAAAVHAPRAVIEAAVDEVCDALDAYADATQKLIDCLVRSSSPAKGQYEAKLRQVRDAKNQLVREKSKLPK